MAQPYTLASLGQRYQNYPAATFDQRFGPYSVAPRSDCLLYTSDAADE